LLLQLDGSFGETVYSFKEIAFKLFHLFLCLRANALASALLLNPHLRNAKANLVGFDLVPMPPLMPPNLAAKLTLRGEVPRLKGALRFDPVVLLK